MGLVILQIGNGTVISGVFENINWGNGLYFLKMLMDENSGNSYHLIGITQLLSVPYALHSASTGDTSRWRKNNEDLYYNNGNVGIGTSTPEGILDIAGEYHFPGSDGNTGQVLKTNGSGALSWDDDALGEGTSDSITYGGPATAADERWFIGVEMNGIVGSWNELDDCMECCKVFDLDWSVYLPYDGSSGVPMGTRRHNAFTVYKNIDKASVMLLQRLVTNELIDEIMLKFYRVDVPSKPANFERYYTITLSDVRVVDFHHDVYHIGNSIFAHLDKVSFIYQSITWLWEDGGIEYQDNWYEPQGK